MKFAILLGLAALAANAPVSARPIAPTPVKLFACSLGDKTVSVTAVGSRLTYRYGTPVKAELSIVGDAATGNVLWLMQRFAGPEYQLRFRKGDFSYIVYSSEGNGRVGASATSGLVVMRGTETIFDKPCSRYTEFSVAYDFGKLPEDTDKYSAM